MHSPNLEALADVRVTLSALLGNAQATIREILELRSGSIVPLHVAADGAVPLLVNGVTVARGEIVTLQSGYLALEIMDVTLPPEFETSHD